MQPIWRGDKTFREDGFPAQKESFVQFFSPDWEPNLQPSNYHFATHLRQFDNISSPQKERIRNVLSYAFPCAWPLKRLVENNMGKGFIDKAEENRWHPLNKFSSEPRQFSCRAYETRAESLVELSPLQVGMTRLELATSRPPDVCATNCATSRNLSFVLQR